jgi:hypothetical protein
MGLTKKEREILREPIRNVIKADKSTWYDLKYETQHDGIQQYFPYYINALKLWDIAEDEIGQLPDADKTELIKQWRSRPRVINLTSDEEILARYAMIVLDEVVKWACAAGNRTIHW